MDPVFSSDFASKYFGPADGKRTKVAGSGEGLLAEINRRLSTGTERWSPDERTQWRYVRIPPAVDGAYIVFTPNRVIALGAVAIVETKYGPAQCGCRPVVSHEIIAVNGLDKPKPVA